MDGKRPWMLSVQRFRREICSDGTAKMSHGVCVEAVQTPWCFAFPFFFFGNELESIPSQKVAETYGKGENQDQP